MKHPRIIALLGAFLCLTSIWAETTKTKVVESGGQGPYKAIVCAESTLPDYTIYRPKNLAAAVAKEGPLPCLVWGNGACSNTNLGNEMMLNEIASRGYMIVAVGPFLMNRDGFVDSGTDGNTLKRAVDWIAKQATDTTSEYHGLIDTKKIAASGHSCGGAEAMFLSTDTRVKTIIMMNSGMGGASMAGATPSNVNKIHGPTLYVVGGPDDVAYGNALTDYDNITVKQPVCFMTKNVGHGGTFHLAHGGEYGKIMPDWLDWVFKGKKENIKIFRDHIMPSGYQGWEAKSKNMPVYLDESAPVNMKQLGYLHGTYTLPRSTASDETATWEFEELEEGYVHLTDRQLVIDRQPEGIEPVTVGRMHATIQCGNTTTKASNWVTLAPTEDAYGVAFAYADPNAKANLAMARYNASRKYTYSVSGKDIEGLVPAEDLPANQGTSEMHVYRDIRNRNHFVMTCNDNSASATESHGIVLLQSTDMQDWSAKAVDFRQGKSAFIDSDRTGSIISEDRYQKLTRVSAPRIVRNILERDMDSIPYYATCIIKQPTDKNPKLYYTRIDSSFTAMTQPRNLWDPKANLLDAVIELNPYDSLYHILYITKNGTEPAVLYHASAKRMQGGTWPNTAKAMAEISDPQAVTVYRAPNKAAYNLYTYDAKGIITHWQTDFQFENLTNLGTLTRPKATGGSIVVLSESEYNALNDWATALRQADVPEVGTGQDKRYNMMGQPVADGFRGITIQRGRKILMSR